MEQAFSVNTLRELRQAVLAEATTAGMPDDRAIDVMIAVHELAANAVLHGAGAGWLRMRVIAGELHCQVTDAGPGSRGGDAARSGADAPWPWPFQPGHGLWVVRNAADHVSIAVTLNGSKVEAVFTLPPLMAARAVPESNACLRRGAGQSR